MSPQEIIQKSQKFFSKSKLVSHSNQKKIVEFSQSIIDHQTRDIDLKDPPQPPQNHMSQSSVNFKLQKNERMEDTLRNDRELSKDNNQRTQNRLDLMTQSVINPQTYTQSQLNSMSALTFNSPTEKSTNFRYKSYSDLKFQSQAQGNIPNYSQLKIKDKDQITGFFSASPQQEFEQEIQANQNLLMETDGDQEGFYNDTIYGGNGKNQSMNRSFLGRSVSPRIKTKLDFSNPYKLDEKKEKKPEEIKIEQINAIKQKTTGRFYESLEVIRHGGQHWKVDKQWLMKSNPQVDQLLKHKEEFELKRVHNKKHQKRLQAMALDQDMKIENRKIYKKFVKY